MIKNRTVLILFDLLVPPPPNGDYRTLLKEEDLSVVREVKNSLIKDGYEVSLYGVRNDLKELSEVLNSTNPGIVFNLAEAFHEKREFEPHLVALLELAKIPYTGAGSFALQLCKDKGLTKKILKYHNIRVPKFLVAPLNHPLKNVVDFPFPAIVKPLGLEASEGIAQLSLVTSPEELIERQSFLHSRLKTDVIVEEFIDGRELYVGVMGNNRLSVFPPRELIFSEAPKGEPLVATYKAKWDENFRKRWGVKTVPAKDLSPQAERQLMRVSKKIYKLFDLKGYCRFDFRLNTDGDLAFIEANPNPSLGSDDDFSLAAAEAGLTYSNLLERLIALGHNGRADT